MSKRFINSPRDFVSEAMQGVSLDASRVTLVNRSTGYAIAVRSSLLSRSHTPRVSVISGGGSGHEPMAPGYIGDGMLTGAVVGGVFSAPSIHAITTLLDTVALRSTGVLVIVMNYDGDRMNFTRAVDDVKRRNPTYPIDVVMVKDDSSIPDADEPRGIAGTVFVIKVAGAAAEQGRGLAEVGSIARTAERSLASFGVALEPCTIPGHDVDSERLASDQIELGMGIHNERGIECRRISETTRESFTSELIADVCGRIDTALQQRHDVVANCASLAVMVNNLGAVSQAEMLIVNKCVADFIYGANASVFNGTRSVHMFTGSFMTSLQMTGISVTCFLIPSDDGHMAHLLHAPTAVTAWNSGFRLLPPAERPIDVVPGVDAGHLPHPTGPQYSAPSPLVSYVVQPQRVYSTPSSSSGSPLNGAARGTRRFDSQSGLNPRTERYIIAITNALIRHANELGNLDSRIGDGDMGDTVQRGCDKIRSDLDRGVYASAAGNPSHLFRLMAQSCNVMGGSIGSLTMAFLEAVAESFQRQPQHSREPLWRAAVVDGTNAVMQHGGAQVGDRTLIDALKPAADVLAESGRPLAEAARAARLGCESTKSMTRARRGRSRNASSTQLLNRADPGAYAIAIIFEALVQAALP